MHVTDIYLQPNDISTSGTASGLIGRDDGDDFPRPPSINFIASPTQKFHFTTPYIILEPGEAFAIHNYSSSDWPVDIFASGYLAASVSL